MTLPPYTIAFRRRIKPAVSQQTHTTKVGVGPGASMTLLEHDTSHSSPYTAIP